MITAERARLAPPPAVPLDGPTLFARHAFGPDRLDLGGPDEWPWLAAKPADGALPVHAFLDDRQHAALVRSTQHQLTITNHTI